MARSAAQRAADKRYAEKTKDRHRQFAVNLNVEEYARIVATLEAAGMSKAAFLRWAAEKLQKEKSVPFSEKEENYTALIKAAAEKQGCVFFEDSGEGRDLETDTLYLEDVSGWLAPIGTPEKDAKKDENYRFAEWKKCENGEFVVEFKRYDLP